MYNVGDVVWTVLNETLVLCTITDNEELCRWGDDSFTGYVNVKLEGQFDNIKVHHRAVFYSRKEAIKKEIDSYTEMIKQYMKKIKHWESL